MKKLFTVAAILLSLATYAQDSTKAEQYCELVATGRMFSRKVTIEVDYGDNTKWLADQRIKDEQGKIEKFNSLVDALNFMGKDGWKLVNAFPITTSGSGNVYHFFFKKEFAKQDAGVQ